MKTINRSIAEEVLKALIAKGHTHPLLNARLQYKEASQLYGHFVTKVQGQSRVYPDILPTQASGRWSTTNPPLTNYPRHDPRTCGRCIERHDNGSTDSWCPRDLRGLFLPDPGTRWLCWDHDAIEAYIAMVRTRDEQDLEAHRQGWDLHLMTAVRMFQLPMPPVRSKAVHTAPEAAQWRQDVSWGGSEDIRRAGVKTARYGLLYAPRERPEMAILGAKGLPGMDREAKLAFARKYIASKAHSYAVKHKVMDQIIATGEARTAFGRVRRFVRVKNPGQLSDYAKQGWSHEISGTVTGIMNRNLIRLVGEAPYSEEGLLRPYGCFLAMNVHDAAKIVVPEDANRDKVLEVTKSVVNREWELWGTKITLPATFYWLDSEGHHEDC